MLVNGVASNLINIRDRGLLYGDGVFRTLRAVQGKVLNWRLHYQKLQHDSRALGIVCPDEALLLNELDRLLAQHPNGVLKLIVTRGRGARGYAPTACTEPTHIWDVSPLPIYPVSCLSLGIKARLCQLRLSSQPQLAGVKHLNRLENVLAAAEWNDEEIAEGLLLDMDGNVIEGTRCNLFLVSQGALLTPDISRCGVAGVQRERVMAWALQQGISLQVRDICLNDLWQAEELFLVNSIIGLWSIRELERHCWSGFPMAIKIRQDLENQTM